MRKALSVALALVMILALAAPVFAAEENPFQDIAPSKYYYEPVLWALENGITKGTSNTQFSPRNTCTRKQIVTFLWRYAGSPEPESMDNPFTDVKHDQFEKAILWAYNFGVTNGTSETKFSPENPCTRKQVVTFLWRYFGQPETDVSDNPFTDVKQDRFEMPIMWAYNNGITTGKTATTFAPDNSCSRAEIVTFLYRADDAQPVWINDLEVPTEGKLAAGKTENFIGYIFDMYLTMHEANGLQLIVNGETYEAGETGVLEAYFPAAEGMGRPMPLEFQLVNTGDSEVTYSMSFTYPTGTMMNPESLFNLSQIQVTLEAGNFQGYYYSYYCRGNGTLKISSADFDYSKFDVILTSSGSYTMNMMSESDDGSVYMDVKAGDTVTIQVVSMPDASFNYPALDTVLSGEFIFPVGAQSNPEPLFNVTEIHVSVPEGNTEGYYYTYHCRAEGTLNIYASDYDPAKFDVVLTSDGSYAMNLMSESESGMVSMDVKPGDTVTIQVAAIPDAGWNFPAVDTVLNGEFVFPVGSQANPEPLFGVSEISLSLSEGNSQGYYYTYTCRAEGKLILSAENYDSSKFDVVLTSSGSYAMHQMSSSANGTVSMDVKYGDVVTIQVVAVPDATFNYPAVEVVLTGDFEFPVGTQMNPEAITNMTGVEVSIPAGNNQGYYYSWTSTANGELTITAENFDPSKYDVTLTCSGSYAVNLMSENDDGTVSIDVAVGDKVTIQICAVPNGSWEYPAVDMTFGLSVKPSGDSNELPAVPLN